MSSTAIACIHEEVLDYVGRRHLGYCRKCGRTMEYDDEGGEPRDVTAEFDGNCPFPSPFESSHGIPITPRAQDNRRDAFPQDDNDHYTLTPARSRVANDRRHDAGAVQEQGPRLGKGGGRNNRERERYYLAHKDEILADVRELGRTEARKKWDIPSSTFTHHMQRWGVGAPRRKSPEPAKPGKPGKYESDREAITQDIITMRPADVCRKWGIPKGSYDGLVHRWGLREQRDEAGAPLPPAEETTLRVPEGAADKRGNMAKSRHWKEHFGEIVEDMRTLGRDATQAKWGMGDTWLRDHGLAGKAAPAQPAEASALATPVRSAMTGGNGNQLPPWSESWDPAVQVEWLRSWTVVECTKVLREEAEATA